VTLIENIREWREERRLAQEAAGFPDAELAGLGLSRADFNAVSRMTATRVARMEIMAGLHGVTDAQLDADPATRLEVSLTCAHCGVVRDCTRELTNPNGTTAERCGFCPNSETFTALAHGA
jgi:uncharacterized protein YjiS (DUF1127 family)